MKRLFTIPFFFLFLGLQAQDVVYQAPEAPVINGLADEAFWQDQEWRELKYLYFNDVDSDVTKFPAPPDVSGRYRIVWKGTQLFILAEITDDILINPTYNGEPRSVLGNESLEIFIDEDNSGGAHTKTHNAFAYHISPNGNVADQCGCGVAGDYGGGAGNPSPDWDGRLYNNNVQSKWTKNGTVYTWEVAISIYNDTYQDGAADNSGALVTLSPGKTMGYGVAYNDYDQGGTRQLIGSFFIPGKTNGIYGEPEGRNVAWQDASSFGELVLDGTVTGMAEVNSGTKAATFYDNTANKLVLSESAAGKPMKVYATDGRLIKEMVPANQELYLTDLNPGLYIVTTAGETIKIAVR